MPQGHSCGFFMARSVKSVRTFKSQESLEIDDSDMSWKNKFSPAHGKRNEIQGLAAEMLERSRSPFRVMVYSENRICDDRQEYPSLDGTNSSASLECSSEYSESEGPCSPQEGSRSNVLNFEAKLRERGSPLGWSAPKSEEKPPDTVPRKPSSGRGTYMWEEKREKRQTAISEVEMMKERFARLLLGEDMSGGRKGVSTALAISNAITNLSASVFGEFRRLEPLPSERKTQWKREMEWLLSVTDHIVELKPTWQKYPNGTSVEVMVSSPRPDLHINLPALRKLDTMLLECLDGFEKTEFWYVDQGVAISDTDEQSNLSNSLPRQEEKWWLPSPRVPASGLCEDSKRRLQQQRESINQVLKAAMAINAQILSEMEVPDVYWEALPKNGRSSLGEMIYHNLISDHFSPEMILSSFDLSTEHNALDLANRIEAAIHAWRRKNQNRKETLIERAETLLLCLKLKFPGLPQTLLDIHKLQYNKDVGQSILESYSRVLESLAYNIIARIDDVLYADEQAKEANQGWSYARHLESGIARRSPPGRD